MSNSIILKITQRTDEDGVKLTWLDTKHGRLGDRPKIVDGKLVTSDVFLIARSLVDGQVMGDGVQISRVGDRLVLLHGGVAHGPWTLHDQPVEFSDGPPHPSKLQLAVRA